MEQLLQIQNVPLAYELKINHARYEMKTEDASVEIKRDRGSFTVNNQPAQMRIDTVNMRASMGFLTNTQMVQRYARNGYQTALQAIGNAAQEGTMLMQSLPGQNVVEQMSQQQLQSNIEMAIAFTPSVPADISWEKGSLSMQYEMDKLVFDWRTNRPQMEYIPGNVEYYIKQMPKTEITYIGRPLYVPPSADPKHEPNSFDISA